MLNLLIKKKLEKEENLKEYQNVKFNNKKKVRKIRKFKRIPNVKSANKKK